MPGSLLLISGPAGSNKSTYARGLVEDDELDILIEYSELWAATRGIKRLPNGRLPIRKDDDVFVESGYGNLLKATAVRLALKKNLRVAVSSSLSDDAAKWQMVAIDTGATFKRRLIDPGEDVVRQRLADADTGELSAECENAVRRWYK